MEFVKLKNGSEEPVPVVGATMMSLENLLHTYPGHFYELVMKCRDRSYKLLSDSQKVLRALGLIQNESIGYEEGSVHSSIRNVVLSAVEGDGIDMVLGWPVDTQDK